MTLRTALAALLLTSCVGDAIWWELPPDMTDDERAAFGEGIELDNAIAIRQQLIALPGAGTRRVILLRPEHMVNGPHVSGEYAISIGVMNLLRGQTHKQLVMVVAHEGMHAVGMAEHVDGAGIMNPSGLKLANPDDPVEFSEADLAGCRRVEACR